MGEPVFLVGVGVFLLLALGALAVGIYAGVVVARGMHKRGAHWLWAGALGYAAGVGAWMTLVSLLSVLFTGVLWFVHGLTR